jgi:hypothetical protein
MVRTPAAVVPRAPAKDGAHVCPSLPVRVCVCACVVGVERDVVLGYDRWQDYDAAATAANCYLGVVVGRFANRYPPLPPHTP